MKILDIPIPQGYGSGNGTIVVTCEQCHKELDVSIASIKNKKLRGMKYIFCSKQCAGKFKKEHSKGKTIVCANCGKKHYKQGSEISVSYNAHRHFCSMNCQISYRQRNNTTETCKHCGKDFEIRDCHKGVFKFCSEQCRKDHTPHHLVSCFECHKQFEIPDWDHQRNQTKRFYCSPECLRTGRLHLAKPTQFELRLKSFLDQLFPDSFSYVGNGDVWISNMNPDFIHHEKKIVIEAQGCWFHGCRQCHPHGGFQGIVDNSLERQAKYIALGFVPIFIWEHEFKTEHWSILKDRIKEATNPLLIK